MLAAGKSTASRLVTLRFPRGCGALVETVRVRLEEMVKAGAVESELVSGEASPVVDLAPLPAL